MMPLSPPSSVRFPMPPRPVSPPRILLVDDYPDSARSMAFLLRLWGYQPLVAFDGIAGLEMAISQRPNAIFLDIRMPRMNGYDVARRIRAEPGMEKTPLLALTGCGTAGDRQASLAAGFDHHLLKPVNLEELRHLLAELLATPLSTPAPSLPGARTWEDGSLEPLDRVGRETHQWVELPLCGNVVAARQ